MKANAILPLIVSCIIVMAVAIPIVNSMGSTISTEYENESIRYYASNVLEEELVYTVNGEDIYINGVKLTPFDQGGFSVPIIITDTVEIRKYGSDPHFTMHDGTTPRYLSSITVSVDGNWSGAVASSETVLSGTYDKIIFAHQSGDLGLITITNSITTVHVDHGDTMYMVKGAGNSVLVKSWTDGNVQTYVSINDETNVIDFDPVNSYSDDEVSWSVNPTYSYTVNGTTEEGAMFCFVPVEYHIITDNDSLIRTLVFLIPVMLVVGLIVMTVYGSVLRRD